MDTMTARMDIGALAPQAYKGMAGLDGFVQKSALPTPLVDLVKLRASQLNGCAYCVDMHSADAKAAGETDARLHAVAVWREAPFFTERERAAFAFTEAVTRLSESTDRVPDDVWRRAAGQFDEPDLAALLIAVVAINAWNRICVATRMVPESYRPE